MRRWLGDGMTMVTLDELQQQLGSEVTDEMLRKWSTRHGMKRVRADGLWWYQLESAIEIEWLTRGRGRSRGGRAKAA